VHHGSEAAYKTSQSTINGPLPEMRKSCSSTCPLQNLQQEAGIANQLAPNEVRASDKYKQVRKLRFLTCFFCLHSNLYFRWGHQIDRAERALTDHLAEIADRASVGNVVRGQACSPSLIDPVLKLGKSVDAVSVGADDNGDSEVFCGSGMDVVEVQSAAVSIDFHHAPVIGGRLEHLGKADLRPRPLSDHSSARMTDCRNVRVPDRIQQPFVDLIARLLQSIVQNGDDPVSFSENIIRQVHRCVFQNVALDPAQNFNA
jgi:hypothetical protein